MSKDKPPAKPVWWKNTFFWFGAILFVLAVVGAIFGERSIRDPGQVKEAGLGWIYLGGAVVMLVNGLLTHNQAVRVYAESREDE